MAKLASFKVRAQHDGLTQHVMGMYRECQRRPPGPGFEVELVKPSTKPGARFTHTIYSLTFEQRCPQRTFTWGGTLQLGPTNQKLPGVYDTLLCCVPGPEGTDWQGGYFPVLVQYNLDLLSPPRVFFPTPFLHTNAYPSGMVCVSTLDQAKSWHPSLTLAEVLLSVQAWLSRPNHYDPAQTGPYVLFKQSPGLYGQLVRRQAMSYTRALFDKWVLEHCVPGPICVEAHPNPPAWTADGEHRIVVGQGG